LARVSFVLSQSLSLHHSDRLLEFSVLESSCA